MLHRTGRNSSSNVGEQHEVTNGDGSAPISLPAKLVSPGESSYRHKFDTIVSNKAYMKTMTLIPESSVNNETCPENINVHRMNEEEYEIMLNALPSGDTSHGSDTGLPTSMTKGQPGPHPLRLSPIPDRSPKRKRHQALKLSISVATITNERYSLTEPLRYSNHENDDRYFITDDRGNGTRVFAVFDGHDGHKASEMSMYYMKCKFDEIVKSKSHAHSIDKHLEQVFNGAECHFFNQISGFIREKKSIQAKLPQGIDSHEAYMRYPEQVRRLQELEQSLAGGTTATVAMIYNGQELHVANVGDTRAILVSRESDGKHNFDQLSTDHSVDNPEELERLVNLCGLDGKELKKNGRLGSQKNTRSIGDYHIKEGYEDVDTFCMAFVHPGTAVPTISAPRVLTEEHVYLIIMTDGVYKSIEQYTNDSSHVNLTLMKHIEMAETECRGQYNNVAMSVLAKIKMEHERRYRISAKQDPRSHFAVQCRKRDDMTMILCKFT